MNRIFFIGAIFVSTTFLATNIPNTAMSYSCSGSASTSHIAITTQISGSSGSCASTSSAVNNLHQGSGTASGFGPNGGAAAGAFENPSHVEIAISSAAGGAQSSCSSTSTTNSGEGGATTITQSTSKSGACP